MFTAIASSEVRVQKQSAPKRRLTQPVTIQEVESAKGIQPARRSSFALGVVYYFLFCMFCFFYFACLSQALATHILQIRSTHKFMLSVYHQFLFDLGVTVQETVSKLKREETSKSSNVLKDLPPMPDSTTSTCKKRETRKSVRY